jgi:hypothetical protein
MRFGRVGIHHQLSLPPVLQKVLDGHATPPVEHREGRLRWERSAKRHLAFSQACSPLHNVEPAVEVWSTRTSSPDSSMQRCLAHAGACGRTYGRRSYRVRGVRRVTPLLTTAAKLAGSSKASQPAAVKSVGLGLHESRSGGLKARPPPGGLYVVISS